MSWGVLWCPGGNQMHPCVFWGEGGWFDLWAFQWTGHSVNFGSFLAFAHYKHFYQRKFRNKNFGEERNFDRMAQQNIDPAANTSRNIKDTNLSTLSSKETHSVSKRYTDLLIKKLNNISILQYRGFFFNLYRGIWHFS